MTRMLGITNDQYLAVIEFEKFYKSRQNLGLNQIEKNQDIDLAKKLFTAWDLSRKGKIKIEILAENLISFGLAMDK